jgi:cobalt-zinc-cadmium efflux system outer membrane protein
MKKKFLRPPTDALRSQVDMNLPPHCINADKSPGSLSAQLSREGQDGTPAGRRTSPNPGRYMLPPVPEQDRARSVPDARFRPCSRRDRWRRAATIFLAVSFCLAVGGPARADQAGLTVSQLVAVALQANPQVRAARARWFAATHNIKQNYAPADPIFTFLNEDSPYNPFFVKPTLQSFQVSQPLQFPGKGYLQAQVASRNADIARFIYLAAMRDVRAQVETAYYQLLLDSSLINVANLRQVLNVAQVAYTANRVTQTDFVNAEFALAAAQQVQRQSELSRSNDKTTLNQLLYRRPDEPLQVSGELPIGGIELSLDQLITLAKGSRQEILEAALAQRNSQTALTLARLEYAPDYTVGYTFDHFLYATAGPAPTWLQDHTVSIGFNVPIFFWLKQREDNQKAAFDLDAAREDLNSVINQTAAQVTLLYRQAQFAYATARLYRATLIPLAVQAFEVGLVSYTNGKIDFTTLINTFRQHSDARVAYLQALNQALAQRIALEQAIGRPLPQK